ncbi:MAG: hypothetical protein HQL50_03270 [Magnetococcales bacterium]|nr:hypothetical protein [Magnetococcales bacterium]
MPFDPPLRRLSLLSLAGLCTLLIQPGRVHSADGAAITTSGSNAVGNSVTGAAGAAGANAGDEGIEFSLGAAASLSYTNAGSITGGAGGVGNDSAGGAGAGAVCAETTDQGFGGGTADGITAFDGTANLTITFSNSGTIKGGDGGAGENGATINNSGMNGGAGGAGVCTVADYMRITNTGTITGGAGGDGSAGFTATSTANDEDAGGQGGAGGVGVRLGNGTADVHNVQLTHSSGSITGGKGGDGGASGKLTLAATKGPGTPVVGGAGGAGVSYLEKSGAGSSLTIAINSTVTGGDGGKGGTGATHSAAGAATSWTMNGGEGAQGGAGLQLTTSGAAVTQSLTITSTVTGGAGGTGGTGGAVAAGRTGTAGEGGNGGIGGYGVALKHVGNGATLTQPSGSFTIVGGRGGNGGTGGANVSTKAGNAEDGGTGGFGQSGLYLYANGSTNTLSSVASGTITGGQGGNGGVGGVRSNAGGNMGNSGDAQAGGNALELKSTGGANNTLSITVNNGAILTGGSGGTASSGHDLSSATTGNAGRGGGYGHGGRAIYAEGKGASAAITLDINAGTLSTGTPTDGSKGGSRGGAGSGNAGSGDQGGNVLDLVRLVTSGTNSSINVTYDGGTLTSKKAATGGAGGNRTGNGDGHARSGGKGGAGDEQIFDISASGNSSKASLSIADGLTITGHSGGDGGDGGSRTGSGSGSAADGGQGGNVSAPIYIQAKSNVTLTLGNSVTVTGGTGGAGGDGGAKTGAGTGSAGNGGQGGNGGYGIQLSSTSSGTTSLILGNSVTITGGDGGVPGSNGSNSSAGTGNVDDGKRGGYAGRGIRISAQTFTSSFGSNVTISGGNGANATIGGNRSGTGNGNAGDGGDGTSGGHGMSLSAGAMNIDLSATFKGGNGSHGGNGGVRSGVGTGTGGDGGRGGRGRDGVNLSSGAGVASVAVSGVLTGGTGGNSGSGGASANGNGGKGDSGGNGGHGLQVGSASTTTLTLSGSLTGGNAGAGGAGGSGGGAGSGGNGGNGGTGGSALYIGWQTKAITINVNSGAVLTAGSAGAGGAAGTGPGGNGTAGSVGTAGAAVRASSSATGAIDLNINGGTLTGGIELSDRAHTIDITGGTITGMVDAGSAATPVTISPASGNTATLSNSGGTALRVDGNNGTLTFGGAGTVKLGGNIVEDDGDNDLLVTINGGGTIQHTAASTIGGYLNVDNSTVNVGSNLITINDQSAANDSNFDDNSALKVTIGGGATAVAGTDYGQLKVDNSGGTADLELGSITITPTVGGTVKDGDSYTIVDVDGNLQDDTGAGRANVADIALAGTSGLLKYSLAITSTNNIALVANYRTVSEITTTLGVTLTGNEKKVLTKTMGGGLLGGDPGLASALGTLNTGTKLKAALKQLTPDAELSDAGASNMEANRAVSKQIQHRVDYLALRGSRAGNRRIIDMVNSGEVTGMATGEEMFAESLWAQSFYNSMRQDDVGDVDGYDGSAWGIVGGIDHLFDGLTLGASLGYSVTSLDGNGDGNAFLQTDAIQVALYGAKEVNGINWEGSASYAYANNATRRSLTFGGLNRVARADFRSDTYSARIGASMPIILERFTLEPRGEVKYVHIASEAYTETGAGSANLRITPSAVDQVSFGLGGAVAYPMKKEKGTLVPELAVMANWDAGAEASTTMARFSGSGSNFEVVGKDPDTFSTKVSGKVTYDSDDGRFSVGAGYDGDFSNSFASHAGNVKVRFNF